MFYTLLLAPFMYMLQTHEKIGGKKHSLTCTKALSGSPPPCFRGRRALGVRTALTEANGHEIDVSGSGSDGESS
jgi:hypothetical protein